MNYHEKEREALTFEHLDISLEAIEVVSKSALPVTCVTCSMNE